MELDRKSNLIDKLKFDLNFQLRFGFCPYFDRLNKDQPYPQRKFLNHFPCSSSNSTFPSALAATGSQQVGNITKETT